MIKEIFINQELLKKKHEFIARAYDQRALELEKEYDSAEMKIYRQSAIDLLIKNLPKKNSPLKIFEYGAGIGKITREFIVGRPAEIIAVDLSPLSLKTYEEKVKAQNPSTIIQPIVADVASAVMQIPETETLDLAYGFGVYQLSPGEIKKTVSELYKRLKPGGAIIFDYLPSHNSNQFESYKNVHGNKKYENYKYGLNYFLKLLGKSEFSDVSINSFHENGIQVISAETKKEINFNPCFVVIQKKRSLKSVQLKSQHNGPEIITSENQGFLSKLKNFIQKIKEFFIKTKEEPIILTEEEKKWLIDFWNEFVVLGKKIDQLPETKEEQKKLLSDLLSQSFQELIKSFGLPIILGKISEVTNEELVNFADQIKLKTDLSTNELEEVDNFISNLLKGAYRKKPVEKEKFYLFWLAKYLSKNSQRMVFDFLPKVALQNNVADCSLATGIGVEIAKLAGLREAGALSMVNHVITLVKASDGQYYGVDFINGRIMKAKLNKRIKVKGEKFELFKLKNDKKFFADSRLGYRGEVTILENEAQTIINNLHYFFTESFFENHLKESSRKDKDKELLDYFKSKIDRNSLSRIRDYYFSTAYEYLEEKWFWKNEKKRVMKRHSK